MQLDRKTSSGKARARRIMIFPLTTCGQLVGRRPEADILLLQTQAIEDHTLSSVRIWRLSSGYDKPQSTLRRTAHVELYCHSRKYGNDLRAITGCSSGSVTRLYTINVKIVCRPR